MKNLIACVLASLLMACGGGGSSASDSVIVGVGSGSSGTGTGNEQLLPPASVPATASFKSIVFEGDSLTEISDITSWPKEISAKWAVSTVNLAMSGTTTVDMLARYVASREKFPASRGLYILNAGTNDFKNGCSSATSYANLKSLWKLARDDGFRVVVFTVRSWQDDAYCESERVALNKLIKSDPSLYDSLIDTDAIFPHRGDRALLFDGFHYSPSANSMVAAAVQTALERLK